MSNNPRVNKRATNWGAQTDFDTVCKRASGRRSYNAMRSFRAALRTHQIVNLAIEMNLSLFAHGTQARIARALGIHRSIVNRAVKAILRKVEVFKPCPVCGHQVWFDRTES